MTQTDFAGIPELPKAKKSGLAIASLVLGIFSPFCFFFFTGIPAVICGHLALGKIKRSNGTLNGKGLAVTGLVLGYVSFFIIFIMGIFSGLAIPALYVALDEAKLKASVSQVRQIVAACHEYADEHEGRFPDSLEQLVSQGLIDKKKLSSPLAARPGGVDYVYTPGLTTESDSRQVLVFDPNVSKQGRLIYCVRGYVDGSVEAYKE